MVWVDWKTFTDRWIERAERGRAFVDDGDRFISLWIAFNGWMRGRFGEGTGDRRQIESVKGMHDFEDVFKRLKGEDCAFRAHLDELRGISVVNMRFNDDREVVYRFDGSFASLVEMLYQVRCNLFHGRKDVNEDEKDVRLVSLAHRILLPLFKAYLSANPS